MQKCALKFLGNLVASQGFEPRLVGSEPTVLPLNEEAILMYGGRDRWELTTCSHFKRQSESGSTSVVYNR